MLNQIVLMGRFTADPEMRKTANQTSVVSFTLAVARDRGDETDFINCVAWRNTADFIHKYFNKGNMACVRGRLQQRDWTDKNGNKRTTFEVIVDEIYFAESRKVADVATPEFTGVEGDGALPF